MLSPPLVSFQPLSYNFAISLSLLVTAMVQLQNKNYYEFFEGTA
jgi:hypothetical protein